MGDGVLMFDTILVVCVGNICRSPTAEALLKNKLQGTGKHVHSAGLGALVDKPIDSTAESILAERSIFLPDHKARQMTDDMLHKADLVLVMENRHLKTVNSISPESRGKTFLIGKWLDDLEIPDPYRQQREAFEHVYRILDDSVTAWLPYLKQ